MKIEFGPLAISLTFNFYDKYRTARDRIVNNRYWELCQSHIEFYLLSHPYFPLICRVRTVLTDQIVKTMGAAHLSPNPNLVMDIDSLIVTRLGVWHWLEWIGLLDRLYTHTNGLGLLAMDEFVRSMGLGSNLIFGVVPYRSFNSYRPIPKWGPQWAPQKSSHGDSSRDQIPSLKFNFDD